MEKFKVSLYKRGHGKLGHTTVAATNEVEALSIVAQDLERHGLKGVLQTATLAKPNSPLGPDAELYQNLQEVLNG